MRGTVVVRVPRAADADAMASVTVDGWRETYGHLLPSRFYDDAELAARRRRWAQLLRSEPLPPRLRVADEDGRVVGFAFAGPSDASPALPPEGGQPAARKLQLYALYVRSSHHGGGVAARLLDAVLDEEPAQLWVAQDNPRAHAFYRKHGFVADGHEQVDPDLDGLLEVRFVR